MSFTACPLDSLKEHYVLAEIGPEGVTMWESRKSWAAKKRMPDYHAGRRIRALADLGMTMKAAGYRIQYRQFLKSN